MVATPSPTTPPSSSGSWCGPAASARRWSGIAASRGRRPAAAPTRGCSPPPRPPDSGEFAVAETLAERGAARFRARGDADGRMRALNLLGVIRVRARQAGRGRAVAGRGARPGRPSWVTASPPRARATTSRRRSICAAGRTRRWGSTAARCWPISVSATGAGTAEAYHNLGLIYRQLGEWRSAEDATGEALRHAEVVGERGLLALATTGRAELQVEARRGLAGVAGAGACRRWASGAGDEVGRAEVERVRALVALQGGPIWRPRSTRPRPPARPPEPTTARCSRPNARRSLALTLKRLGRRRRRAAPERRGGVRGVGATGGDPAVWRAEPRTGVDMADLTSTLTRRKGTGGKGKGSELVCPYPFHAPPLHCAPPISSPPRAPSGSPPPPSPRPRAAPRRSRGTSAGGCPGRG